VHAGARPEQELGITQRTRADVLTGLGAAIECEVSREIDGTGLNGGGISYVVELLK
jgi:hypothetical protein